MSTDDDEYRCSDPITATRLVREAILKARNNGPGDVDVRLLCERVKNYVEQVVGSRRPGETSDQYKFRVLIDLTETRPDDAAATARPVGDRPELMACVRNAAESGDLNAANRWCSQLLACDPDTDAWVLYGTLCARRGRVDEAVECMRRAVALDCHDRLAMFAHAATAITAAAATTPAERSGEIESSLDRLMSVHPRFSEAHFLAAVHYRRMEMSERVDRHLSSAKRFVDAADQATPGGGTATVLDGPDLVWEPIVEHGGDPALKCAVLLMKLELLDLAATCLRCSVGRPQNDSHHHYLMAALHHKRDEFSASAEHLYSMGGDDDDGGRRTLLAAHNDYGAGRTRKATDAYVELTSRPVQARYGLAYSRSGDHWMAIGQYSKAADAFYRACTVAGTPTLMTKFGACLVMLNERLGAESVLNEAIAGDGAGNGDAWYYLAIVHSMSGRTDIANACHRQAVKLGYKSDIGPKFDLLFVDYSNV